MPDNGRSVLTREYDLAGPRSTEKHYILVQSQVDIYTHAGHVKKADTYREFLVCEPSTSDGDQAETFTCAKFAIERGDRPAVTIPSLAGFSYVVDKGNLDQMMYDDRGQFYGLSDEPFQNLTDNTGTSVSTDDAYQIYSAFFYYHSYVGYADPEPDDVGIQDLKRVGDKVKLPSSGLETRLPGWLAGKGSKWRNGQTTLEFKGVAEIDGATCAIIGLVCGPSPWYMPLNLMPIFGLKTYGLSSFTADIYLDLQTRRVRLLNYILTESALVKMWGLVPVDRSYPRTVLTIREMSKEDFDAALEQT
jgi:hypothetical protein